MFFFKLKNNNNKTTNPCPNLRTKIQNLYSAPDSSDIIVSRDYFIFENYPTNEYEFL